MRFHVTIGMLIIVSQALAIKACAENKWSGKYCFSGSNGREAGGMTTNIDISLKIKPNGKCIIHREGYQVLDSMLCNTFSTNDEVVIRFESFPDGSLKNKYGFKIYEIGEVLLTLRKEAGSDKVVTKWGALKPVDYVRGAIGSYFERCK